MDSTSKAMTASRSVIIKQLARLFQRITRCAQLFEWPIGKQHLFGNLLPGTAFDGAFGD